MGADFRSCKVQNFCSAAITNHGIYICVYVINLFVLLCALTGQRRNYWLLTAVLNLLSMQMFSSAEGDPKSGDPNVQKQMRGQRCTKWELDEGTLRAVGIKQVNLP